MMSWQPRNKKKAESKKTLPNSSQDAVIPSGPGSSIYFIFFEDAGGEDARTSEKLI
jgi:hypothetical protein